ncbi:MAG: hypothetical protein V3T05_07920 [Myxococcota bacterium]
MTDTWKLLVDLGLPDGAAKPRSSARLPVKRLRAAVLEEAGATTKPRHTELLLAWLSAWRRHWPSAFIEVFGQAGVDLIVELRSRPHDPNRYLKLRRIATENLAQIL